MARPRKDGIEQPYHPDQTQPGEHVPTRESRLIVSELFAAGISRERIGKRFGIGDVALTKHYEAELDNNKEGMIASLGKSLYQKAIEGDMKSAEFWLKCQGRWSYAKAPEEDKPNKMEALLEKLIDKL